MIAYNLYDLFENISIFQYISPPLTMNYINPIRSSKHI